MSSDKPDGFSKVTFSPVSDGKTDALIVTIKTVKPEGQEQLQVPPRTSRVAMDTPKRSGSSDSKKKSRSTRTSSSSKSKSMSSQTSVELPVPETSGAAAASSSQEKKKIPAGGTRPKTTSASTETTSPRQEKTTTSTETASPRLENPPTPSASSGPGHTSTPAAAAAAAEASPCLKHAAENISLKASLLPAEKLSMCRDCSKSMLSYIFVVQDFLESLAKEIVGGAEPENCVQCMRQESRRNLSVQESPQTKTGDDHRGAKGKRYEESSAQRIGTSQRRQGTAQPPSGDAQRDHGGHDKPREYSGDGGHLRKHHDRHGHHTEQSSHGPQHGHHEHNRDHRDHHHGHHEPHHGHREHQQGHQDRQHGHHEHQQGHPDHRGGYHDHKEVHHEKQDGHHEHQHEQHEKRDGHHEYQHGHHENRDGNHEPQHSHYENQEQSSDNTSQGAAAHQFVKPMTRQQPFQLPEEFDDSPSFPHLESGGPDGLVSTLSTMEREVYDGARTGAGWDSMPHERLVSSTSSSRIASEAFVTMCRNNAEALGCLVVGTSLLLSRTSRTLCVVVSDGVSNAFRGSLSSVFHVVQLVRSMDSLGTTKLALLEQPELGISFEKLNVWRLVQFNKCVFLNPDTLVTQNCDELFCREELSAVPDIGWPDCFNSGVFVYVPSIQTFWQLVEFAEKRGSYDGGDQGLLNGYFNWSDDISKKLSFIYNLMANVSYTYTPAFKQFGRNVKVVQFHGSFKPWHVKFFSRTGQISPASAVHPTYVQFVHIWINIFRISALRQLSQEIQTYANSQEVICAVELLRFFPLPTESESEFFLQPPSVRLRLAEGKMHQRTIRVFADSNPRRKSAEFFHSTPLEEVDVTPAGKPSSVVEKDADIEDKVKDDDAKDEDKEDDVQDKDEEGESKVDEEEKDENALPGAEVGNYMGMKAWEQGRMDYQGSDASDNIIKRLEFLMAQPK